MARDPHGPIIRNMLRLQRAGNAITLDEIAAQSRLFAQIVKDIGNIDPVNVADRYKAARMDKLLRRMDRRFREYDTAFYRRLRDSLAELGAAQSQWAGNTLVYTIGSQEITDGLKISGITKQRLNRIVRSRPFEGKILRDHARTMSARSLLETKDRIKIGMAREESIPEITRRVRGRFVGWAGPKGQRYRRYAGGALEISNRNAEALVRTAVTHVSTKSHMDTYRLNDNVVSMVQFLAVLDDRTTLFCGYLDGRTWPVNSSRIAEPPLHYNCRSTLSPEMDWDALGVPPPPEGQRLARDMSSVSDKDLRRPVGSRRRGGGLGKQTRVPSSLQYSNWLRQQRPTVVQEILGKANAEEFLNGQVSLGDLLKRDWDIGSLRGISP